ncbi:nucleoside recognition domain-containing protein [Clostridium estertheticum]|uniref:Nucleoside transporter/FeoB GTPase Gate domain-containing protein n=1 Tax=Clostridium estertheticum TaxID=238834 RepID=A0AA47EM75_9CLOT|nr:nucleoside recognition domain-containing protein [Clostridium estertheticum]MBU3157160.1 hypothetical protein [Clostridium estertheticum]WAG62670.1 hypothetical protein LL038_10740 [Clostridium estertheticum]
MKVFLYNKNNFFNDVFWAGLKDGFKASLSIIKIMIPISLIITLLKYFGFVNLLGEIVSPLFGFLGLRGESILVLISGYFINCYSAIAVMATLPLSIKEITILSTMILLCHTLPVELAVQKKAGGSFFLIMFIRVFSSLFIGVVLNHIIPNDVNYINIKLHSVAVDNPISFSKIIIGWLIENLIIIKIIIINVCVTIFYKILERYNIIGKVSRTFKYLMFIFGLPEETAFLWIVTNIIGLIYGASMLIDAKNKRSIDDLSLRKLNVSIATCHSLVQETANFLTIGASMIYLIIPRVIISIISVWIYNLFLFLKSSKVQRLKGSISNLLF